MLATIGIPTLLILFCYIGYQFIKTVKPNEKTIFFNSTKTGRTNIPGMRTQKSKKRRL